jgi:ribosomal protein L3 glutamine methyltransferase
VTTLGEAWREAETAFRRARLHYGHGTHNARDEAAWLVCTVARVPFDALDASVDVTLQAGTTRRIRNVVAKRIEQREPLAYLLNEAWLGPHRFYVDRRVIVPRSFIAELLPDALRPWLARGPVRAVLDLCTGSGCLAILAALAWRAARVDAVDLSSAALSVAKRNVSDYRLTQRVRLVRSDLFDALPDARYDLMLSNPPYVDGPSMRRLPTEYRHEPEMALAGGRDGLDLVHRMLAEASARLTSRGVLVVEIGHNRAALERAYPRMPFVWLNTSAGDRFVFLLRAGDLTLENGIAVGGSRRSGGNRKSEERG